jgi:hypothetical protein
VKSTWVRGSQCDAPESKDCWAASLTSEPNAWRALMPAALTAIQRFGSAINLHVHAHVLAPDGVFALHADNTLRFVPLPEPSDHDIEALAYGVARRVERLLAAQDHSVSDAEDRGPLDQALTEALPQPRPCAAAHPRPLGDAPLCASAGGFTVHAAVTVAADDRQGLVHLIRYALRPPVVPDRLSRLPDGRYRYRLRRRWVTGATDIVFDPLALMRRLALLMPHPRQHLLRTHGLFAPHAAHRAKLAALLPPSDEPQPAAASAHLTVPGAMTQPIASIQPDGGVPAPRAKPCRPARIAWSTLLRRVFQIDVAHCPKCKGPLRLIALITELAVITRILTHLGLSPEPVEPKPVSLAYLAAYDDEFTEDPSPPPPAARGPPPVEWLCLPPN